MPESQYHIAIRAEIQRIRGRLGLPGGEVVIQRKQEAGIPLDVPPRAATAKHMQTAIIRRTMQLQGNSVDISTIYVTKQGRRDRVLMVGDVIDRHAF